MSLIEDIKKLAADNKASLSEKKDVYTFQLVVAERKSFFSKKRLEYIAKFRVDDDKRELKFTEMLKESGFGLSFGGVGDDEMSSGAGFKTTSYKSGFGGREETIEEQSNLFGKTYQYQFDFKTIRQAIEALAQAQQYGFHYQMTSIGL